MKIVELLEGRWVAKSLDGKVRRFKDLADAAHWRKNISTHVIPAKERGVTVKAYLDALDAEEAKVQAEREASRPKLGEIWTKFQQAVDASFPDGDPFDRIGPWMQQHGLTIDDLDRAVAHFNGDHETAHSYLSSMWDEHASGAEHDAMMGAHGQTYDDQWFQRPNPWK